MTQPAADAKQVPLKIRNSVEFQSLLLGAIEEDRAQWSSLDEGESHNIDFDKNEITWLSPGQGGSSSDLYYGIAEGYVSGRLTVNLIKKGTFIEPPIVSIAFDGNVSDLYDFNYFNRPSLSGNAAILQAGWNRFWPIDPLADPGGIGRVYLAKYQVAFIISDLPWVVVPVE